PVEASDDRLDLLRVEVLTAADDHVLDPVDDGEVAVLVEGSDVAGVEPSVDDRLGGLLGPVEIAAHDGGAGDEDLAGFAGGLIPPVLVDDPDLLTVDGGADRAQLPDTVERVDGGSAGGLGEAVS